MKNELQAAIDTCHPDTYQIDLMRQFCRRMMWRDIKDAPRDEDVRILTVDKDGWSEILQWFGYDWWNPSTGIIGQKPTRYMSLPHPPENEDGVRCQKRFNGYIHDYGKQDGVVATTEYTRSDIAAAEVAALRDKIVKLHNEMALSANKYRTHHDYKTDQDIQFGGELQYYAGRLLKLLDTQPKS